MGKPLEKKMGKKHWKQKTIGKPLENGEKQQPLGKTWEKHMGKKHGKKTTMDEKMEHHWKQKPLGKTTNNHLRSFENIWEKRALGKWEKRRWTVWKQTPAMYLNRWLFQINVPSGNLT